MDASDIYAIDALPIKADGTKDKSNLGANAILARVHCRLPCSRCFSGYAALYRFLVVNGNRLPVPMMNILNGGAHPPTRWIRREFMIMPVGALLQGSFAPCAEVSPRSGFHPEGQGAGYLRGR